MQLNVPHIHQSGPTHCGVACLEMVYKYFGITNVGQEDVWVSKRSPRQNSQDYFMLTSSMVQDLIDRGLSVISGQITLDNKLCLGSIKRLISCGTPIIACKQWPGNPILGHFIVIIGVENNDVIYLDPEQTSTPLRVSIEDFVDQWKSTNPLDPNREVVGGQFIIMGNQDKPIKINKLHATGFNVPLGLQSFCLNSVTFVT